MKKQKLYAIIYKIIQGNDKSMLTKAEFDELHKLDKYLDVDENGIIWPDKGKKISINCYSLDNKEQFEITINSSKIKVSKVTYQQLYRDKTILFRLDTSGPRHWNPDGTFVEGPHIHIYKEGYGDKWAYPLEQYISTNPSDMIVLFCDFLSYINIIDIPSIKYQFSLI